MTSAGGSELAAGPPPQGDGGPSARRAVVAAGGVGLGLAVAKTAYVLLRKPDAIESIVVSVALVTGVVAAVAVVGRTGPVATAGLRSPRTGTRGVLAATALVAALAVAVGASAAGPATALRIILATALGEEILFRGVVYGLADRAEARVAALVSSATFCLWHLGDGWEAAASDAGAIEHLAAVAFVLAVTGLAGALVFAPLRRRTGSIYASAVAHAALNLVGTLLARAG